MAANPSVKKREKERARAENRADKNAKRKQRQADRANVVRPADGVDPDIAHIIPGPQPPLE